MTPKHTYGTALAGVDLSKLSGTLIVIEGPDSSGRSTQIALLGQWLEQQGHAVAQAGLRRSDLVGPELERAKEKIKDFAGIKNWNSPHLHFLPTYSMSLAWKNEGKPGCFFQSA